LDSYKTTEYFQVKNPQGKNHGKIFDALVWGLIYMDDKPTARVDDDFTKALNSIVKRTRGISTLNADQITELIIAEIRKERVLRKRKP
jgi:hypothetical protein